MKEEQARAVLLVKAIETGASASSLLSAAQRDAAAARALKEKPRPAADKQRARWTEDFIVLRARHLLDAARENTPRLDALSADALLLRVLRWALPLLGLLAGLAAELWTSPRAINLLSPVLLGFVAWNIVVYVWTAGWTLWRLGVPTPQHSGLSRLLAYLSGLRLGWSQLGKMASAFQHDWLRLAGAGVAYRVSAALHLSAALCAAGMAAALLAKGVATEFRVGWESQWFNAAQVHVAVAWVGSWLGAPDITLGDIERLQGGVGATQADGSVWALWWLRALALLVIGPRLLLAAWAALRGRRQMQALRLDLSDPYFVRLLADHGGPATTAVVWPYSLHLSPAQQTGLQAAVRRRLGPSATLHLLPTATYGEGPGAAPALAATQQRQAIVLFGLGATPEQETHVAFVQRVAAVCGAAPEVWLDSSSLRTHLADGARASRLAEREALWREALPGTTVRVWQLDGPPEGQDAPA